MKGELYETDTTDSKIIFDLHGDTLVGMQQYG
jgi:hypothetical protein